MNVRWHKNLKTLSGIETPAPGEADPYARHKNLKTLSGIETTSEPDFSLWSASAAPGTKTSKPYQGLKQTVTET
jgi:hypothetical protein